MSRSSSSSSASSWSGVTRWSASAPDSPSTHSVRFAGFRSSSSASSHPVTTSYAICHRSVSETSRTDGSTGSSMP